MQPAVGAFREDVAGMSSVNTTKATNITTDGHREQPTCDCPDSCFMCDIGDCYRCDDCPRKY